MNEDKLEKTRQVRIDKISANPETYEEGDIVVFSDGVRRRIGHIYSDGRYQLTESSSFFCELRLEHFGSPIRGLVHLSSGGLDLSMDLPLKFTGVVDADCWAWRELPCAGGGMNIVMPFRVFKVDSKFSDIA